MSVRRRGSECEREEKLWFSYEPERALGHQAKTQRTKADENERAIAVLQKLKYALKSRVEICIKKPISLKMLK